MSHRIPYVQQRSLQTLAHLCYDVTAAPDRSAKLESGGSLCFCTQWWGLAKIVWAMESRFPFFSSSSNWSHIQDVTDTGAVANALTVICKRSAKAKARHCTHADLKWWVHGAVKCSSHPAYMHIMMSDDMRVRFTSGQDEPSMWHMRHLRKTVEMWEVGCFSPNARK